MARVKKETISSVWHVNNLLSSSSRLVQRCLNMDYAITDLDTLVVGDIQCYSPGNT